MWLLAGRDTAHWLGTSSPPTCNLTSSLLLLSIFSSSQAASSISGGGGVFGVFGLAHTHTLQHTWLSSIYFLGMAWLLLLPGLPPLHCAACNVVCLCSPLLFCLSHNPTSLPHNPISLHPLRRLISSLFETIGRRQVEAPFVWEFFT